MPPKKSAMEYAVLLLGRRACSTAELRKKMLAKEYPEQEIIMTAGSKGAYYRGREGFIYQPIIDYPVVDTTAAGDTFIGYYLASCIRGLSVKESLYYASKASGIAVSRPGAMQSVPVKDEIFTEEV